MHFRIYFPACKWVVSSHHASPAILPSSLSLSRFYSYTIRLLQWHYTIWHFVRMMIFRFSTPHIANKRPQMPAAPKNPRKKLTHTKASYYSAKTTIIAGHPSFQMCCNLQPLKLKLLSDSARLLMWFVKCTRRSLAVVTMFFVNALTADWHTFACCLHLFFTFNAHANLIRSKFIQYERMHLFVLLMLSVSVNVELISFCDTVIHCNCQ